VSQDAEIRALERLTAEGDPAARARLMILRIRAGAQVKTHEEHRSKPAESASRHYAWSSDAARLDFEEAERFGAPPGSRWRLPRGVPDQVPWHVERDLAGACGMSHDSRTHGPRTATGHPLKALPAWLRFSARHDAWACTACDAWLETRCAWPGCARCEGRPRRPGLEGGGEEG
jgi:hypothetical protein